MIPTEAQQEAIEAEEKRQRSLPRGWHPIKELVINKKGNGNWIWSVFWFYRKGGSSCESALACKSKFGAEILACMLNDSGVKPYTSH